MIKWMVMKGCHVQPNNRCKDIDFHPIQTHLLYKLMEGILALDKALFAIYFARHLTPLYVYLKFSFSHDFVIHYEGVIQFSQVIIYVTD